jgi:hypothetical protein
MKLIKEFNESYEILIAAEGGDFGSFSWEWELGNIGWRRFFVPFLHYSLSLFTFALGIASNGGCIASSTPVKWLAGIYY